MATKINIKENGFLRKIFFVLLFIMKIMKRSVPLNDFAISGQRQRVYHRILQDDMP